MHISDFLSVCVDEAYTHTRTLVRNSPFETMCRLVDAVLSFETENKYSEMELTVTFRGYSRITQIDIPRITFPFAIVFSLEPRITCDPAASPRITAEIRGE